ncbi:MAG TPA: hypothetical protein VEC38_10980 [Candidatus Binataceae bacterium]|nr:hypothetical protein [Candidatus Binataceae bacterium]
MKPGRFARLAICALLPAAVAATSAFAAEPRPWLCRDKPVFSSDRSMAYEASSRAAGRWEFFFMEFSPTGAHDGFTIVNSTEPGRRGAPQTGTLAPGRYYAVALHRQGEHWICAGYTRDDTGHRAGLVADLCYGESGPDCAVNLLVKPEAKTDPASPPPSR